MEKQMKVLVGYDGSAASDAAMADLKWAGLPDEGEFIVMSVADAYLPPGGADPTSAVLSPAMIDARRITASLLADAEVLAKEAARLLRLEFPGWSIQPLACADSPAWALIKKADEWKPDLIVVGAGGHSGISRFLGSVSQMVLVQSDCSVRVGRLRRSKNSALRILIGVDGSPNCEAVMKEAARRFGSPTTKFLLVSTADVKMFSLMAHMTPLSTNWFLEQADSATRAAERMLEHYAEQLRSTGASVKCLVREDDPKSALIVESEYWRADCILVGARGLGHTKRLLIGGVSLAVAARAQCSVEVIRNK